MKKEKVITIIIFLVTAVISATALAPLKIPRAKGVNIGVMIRDLNTGKDVASQNPDRMLTPASILKCVTAAASLTAGKENDTFLTEVFFQGEQADSTFYGDIIIAGSGDPTLESPRLAGCAGVIDSICAVVMRSGINRICGNIVCDATGFSDQGPLPKWEVEDLKWAYGAGLYAVNYKENTRGADRAILNPGEAFKSALTARLESDSIRVLPPVPDSKADDCAEILMIQHYSPPTKIILREMMEKSHNLYAEAMLRQLAAGYSRAEALEAEQSVLSEMGLNTGNCIIFDGSGLTRNSKVTPRFMTALLQAMSRSDRAGLYTSLFPAAGVEGTVKRFLKDTPLEGKLLLKSGSMNGVQCYAGYKIDDNGVPTHSVVLMVNDFKCRRTVITKALSDYLLKAFPDA